MFISFLAFLSKALGWGYFAAWSLSFWPQTVVMYRRRASTGLSLDFLLLNVLGFACYSASTFALYYSPTMREQYAARHGELPSTHLNDVAFALHGLALCLAQGAMAIVFPKAPTQGVALWAKLVFGALVAGLAGTIGVVWRGIGEKGGLQWLDVVWLLSTEKLIITILKWLVSALAAAVLHALSHSPYTAPNCAQLPTQEHAWLRHCRHPPRRGWRLA